MNATRITLEVCIASVEDALAAEAGGADRLELNSGLELGGLTPSVGLLEAVKSAVSPPVVVMVRPRAAGFRYSQAERKLMLRDSEILLDAGADGIVAGGLREDAALDEPFWRQLRIVCGDRELVFHRAFDVAADPRATLERLVDCGTTRLLTSGGCSTAWRGRDQIAELQQRANGRIEILPGAGIRSDNVAALIRATGCRQVHGGFREVRRDPAGPVGDESYPSTSQQHVAATRNALDQCE